MEMQWHRYIHGAPRCEAQGSKSEVSTSPLPSPGPKRGQICHVTPAYSGVCNVNRGKQHPRWLPHPCLLRCPKESGNATSTLHSRGFPTPSARIKIRSGYLTLALSRGQRGQNCYVTPPFSGVPNTKHGDQNQHWLPHRCLLGGPKEGGSATSSEHSRGSPTPRARRKTTCGYLTLAFSKTQKREQMLCHLCDLGGAQHPVRGSKSYVAASPLPSRGPKKGQKCYPTPTFSEVLNTKRGEQNQQWLPHSCLLTGPKESGNAVSPLRSCGPQRQARGAE